MVVNAIFFLLFYYYYLSILGFSLGWYLSTQSTYIIFSKIEITTRDFIPDCPLHSARLITREGPHCISPRIFLPNLSPSSYLSGIQKTIYVIIVRILNPVRTQIYLLFFSNCSPIPSIFFFLKLL